MTLNYESDLKVGLNCISVLVLQKDVQVVRSLYIIQFPQMTEKSRRIPSENGPKMYFCAKCFKVNISSTT